MRRPLLVLVALAALMLAAAPAAHAQETTITTNITFPEEGEPFGTFNALEHVHLTFSDDDRFTNTGPIQLLGGTGAYTELVGHGVDNGFGQGDVFGVGEISGFIVQGPGT